MGATLDIKQNWLSVKKIITSFLLVSTSLHAMDHLLDLEPTPLISKEQIADQISVVAQQINSDYEGLDLVILLVMKGALCVGADLARALEVPCTIECVQCSSYGMRGKERGELEIFGLDRLNLQNRDVLLVDDIFDTGNTLLGLSKAVAQQQPRSIKSLVLLKKNVPHVDFNPDYVLFDIEDHFVIGYGLDYKEYYRGLDAIFVPKASEPSIAP